MKNKWIDVDLCTPEINPKTLCSENVWATDGKQIFVANYFYDGKSYNWANCYGNVFGDGEFDDDFQIMQWQRIIIPDIKKMLTSQK